MVVGVTFRPLNNVPQPLRCTDVRMLKDAKEVCDQKHDRNRLWGEPGNKTEANAPEYSPTDHVKRAKEKRSISVIIRTYRYSISSLGPSGIQRISNTKQDFITARPYASGTCCAQRI